MISDEEIASLLKNYNDWTFKKPCSIWRKGWSDEVLEELRSPLYFPSKVYDRTNLKYILIRFFHLYLEGSVHKDDNLFSIITDMIALSETKDGKIWAAPPPETPGFYLENNSKPTSLEITLQTSSSHKQKFCNYINNVIQCINSVGTAIETETQVIRLASFLAITLLQSTIKYKSQVFKYLHSDEYKSYLTCVALWPPGNPYCVPCDKCFEICETLEQNGRSKIFTILVHEFVLASKPSYPNSSTAKFLATSVLDSTAGNGIAMITLLEQVCNITSLRWKDVMKATLFDSTIRSWKRINNFAETQWSNSNPQYSYKWARIINNDYFKEISPRENMYLTVIFAGVVEKVNGGIWNSSWAKNIPPSTMRGKQIGYNVYKLYCEDKLKKIIDE